LNAQGFIDLLIILPRIGIHAIEALKDRKINYCKYIHSMCHLTGFQNKFTL